MNEKLKLNDILDLMSKRIDEIRVEIVEAEKTYDEEALDRIISQELMPHAFYICESLESTKSYLEENLLLSLANNNTKAAEILDNALSKFKKVSYPTTQDLVNKECNRGCCP